MFRSDRRFSGLIRTVAGRDRVDLQNEASPLQAEPEEDERNDGSPEGEPLPDATGKGLASSTLSADERTSSKKKHFSS